MMRRALFWIEAVFIGAMIVIGYVQGIGTAWRWLAGIFAGL